MRYYPKDVSKHSKSVTLFVPLILQRIDYVDLGKKVGKSEYSTKKLVKQGIVSHSYNEAQFP